MIKDKCIVDEKVSEYLKKLAVQKYAIVVASKGRPQNMQKVKDMFPNCVLFVNYSEKDDYENCGLPVVWHNETQGYGAVLNCLFDYFNFIGIKYSAVFDDDLNTFNCFVGNRDRKLKHYPDAIEEVIANGCQVMEDLDHPFYQFSSCGSVVKYPQSSPYTVGFSLPSGSSIFRNKDIPRFSKGYQYFEDFDIAMEVIKKFRYIIVENRFGVTGEYRTNEGGCQFHRTKIEMDKAREWIKRKWGKYVNFKMNGTGNEQPICRVKRKAI